jgi:hypothetical protein
MLLSVPSMLAISAASAETPVTASSTVVGTVTACYYSTNCPYANVLGLARPPTHAEAVRDVGEHPAVPRGATPATSTQVDAPAFQFTNTGTAPITHAVFSIQRNRNLGIIADEFQIKTINPGASFVIVPGASNDDHVHQQGAFFAYSGAPLDTSDTGPNEDSVIFVFTGKVNGLPVSSGNIVVGASAGPSGDLTVSKINFLGGPGNLDEPCWDCFDPKVVGEITGAFSPADKAK